MKKLKMFPRSVVNERNQKMLQDQNTAKAENKMQKEHQLEVAQRWL